MCIEGNVGAAITWSAETLHRTTPWATKCVAFVIRHDELAEASTSCLALSGVLKAGNGFHSVAVVISHSHHKSASLDGQKLWLVCAVSTSAGV